MAIQLNWPIDTDKVIEHFGQNPEYWGAFEYTGIDGATHYLVGNDGISIEASFKAEVFACADGIIKEVNTPGDVRPNGNHVVIEHQDNDTIFTTTYCHLFSTEAQVGQAVKTGGIIGLADSTGSATGSQLRLIVAVSGATASGKTEYTTQDSRTIKLMNDIVDPADYLNPTPTERFTVPVKTVSTFSDDVRVRRGPGTNFRILHNAKKDEEVNVLGINAEKTWYNIEYKGEEAWTSADYIDYAGDSNSPYLKKNMWLLIPIQKPDHPTARHA